MHGCRASWRAPGVIEQLGGVEPRDEVVLGAEQHDIGWALFDLDPRYNPHTGLPRSFLETTVEEHLEIWRDAPDRLSSQSLHAALVVSLHGRSLSGTLRARGRPEDAGALQAHIEQERDRQRHLRATLDIPDAQLERTRRQMWTWDGLSLALCNAWRPFSLRDVPAAEGLIDVELRDREDGAFTLDPWPFAPEHLEVRCEARRVGARCGGESEMRTALEQGRR